MTMASRLGLSPPLVAALRSCQPLPESIAALARLFSQAIYLRAAPLLGVSSDDWVDVTWMHPSLVHVARTGESSSIELERAKQLLDAGLSAPPSLYVFGDQTPPAWLQWGLARAAGAKGIATSDCRILTDIDPIKQVVREAENLVRTSWPEAALEMETLIRVVAVVEGPIDSATCSQTFGTIYLGAHQCDDPLQVYIALLHETGHHALYLGQQFCSYLRNPSQLARHPLRADARPLEGVVHAAFALARMRNGLNAYLKQGRSDDSTIDPVQWLRRIGHQQAACLSTLSEAAQWTAEGEALFASLTENKADDPLLMSR